MALEVELGGWTGSGNDKEGSGVRLVTLKIQSVELLILLGKALNKMSSYTVHIK